MPELDILYMTRVQRERFFNEEDYLRLKDSYILTPEKLAGAKKDLAILHPLPRVNEIARLPLTPIPVPATLSRCSTANLCVWL